MLKYLRQRIIPFILTLLLCTIGIVLGQWQTRRAIEKEKIEQNYLTQANVTPISINELDVMSEVVSEKVNFRSFNATGHFLSDWPIYLDNRPLHGVAGFYVVMPFKLDGSNRHILVARGWIPRNVSDRNKIPVLITPDNSIQIRGRGRVILDRVMQLGTPPPLKSGLIVQNLSTADFQKQSGLSVMDFFLEQTSPVPDDLIREWPKASFGAEKHRGYAFQWYGLSLMAIIFFVVTGFIRGKK